MTGSGSSAGSTCPVCGARATFSFAHPDADIYRCPACSHTFSALDTLRVEETYDDRYYEATHRNWFANPNHALFAWIDAHIPSGATSVLDVGCGNGDFLRHLRARRPDARLVGVDLSPARGTEPFERVHADVMETDLPGTYDAVTSLAVIEHVPNVAAFTQRLHDLCRPGGSVVVMTLNADGLLYQSARAGRRLGVTIASDRLYSTHHLHHFTPASLRRVLERSGLVVTQTHHHNAPLRALDLPATGATRSALLAGVAVTFGAGKMLRRCYLQTMVCRRRPVASATRAPSGDAATPAP
jgi:2-polyprenyl-3-methyl-5-hydroxy-6-metoxy-1,4-benzoquinol methylase